MMKNIATYSENDEEDIKRLLFGRKVEKASEDRLVLDNGLILDIRANTGCGGCSSGWYDITELNGCDNAITNVEMVCDTDGEEYGDTSYKIFVYAENKKIKMLQVDGSDGNGYYGTGYEINVTLNVDKEQ